MKSLYGKHILLGITGGIAAYKSAELTRRLRDAGAKVRVVMTQSATEFVTPLTFQALSGNPVATRLLDESAEAAMGHIELARWADAILIAPASANFIARLAQGRADDLLSTLCLASDSLLTYAPAMNKTMWSDLTTQSNCKKLKEKGYRQFGPSDGSLACGETGEGRMMDVPELMEQLAACFESSALQALKVVVTAGPTYEAIDPVRFIGNRSSGRMGFEIARAAQQAGAAVTLVSGPCHLDTPMDVNRIDVETASEMHEAVFKNIGDCNIFISAAAVADYRPATQEQQKIKKKQTSLALELVPNRDILLDVASLPAKPYVVGFAAETENLERHAQEKMSKKHLDMIAANLVGQSSNNQDIGFNSDYNALHVFWTGGQQQLAYSRKSILAKQLVDLIADQYHYKKQHEKNTA